MGTTPAAPTGSNAGSETAAQMQADMKDMMDTQNYNEMQLYSFSSKESFNQTAAQTYGNLVLDNTKNKPEV